MDACLTGCGAFNGSQYYATQFPIEIMNQQHAIAHLELLNVIVAVKVWARDWRGRKVRVHCDNTNACLAAQTGRSRDTFVQACVRELFLYKARFDIDVTLVHTPGRLLVRADALSRLHMGRKYRDRVRSDPRLRRAQRVEVPRSCFTLENEL